MQSGCVLRQQQWLVSPRSALLAQLRWQAQQAQPGALYASDGYQVKAAAVMWKPSLAGCAILMRVAIICTGCLLEQLKCDTTWQLPNPVCSICIAACCAVVCCRAGAEAVQLDGVQAAV
jgi:hypothetical protein